ncbi:hypothetical protein B6V75_18220 [Thioclava sp. F1Mire-8]|uniref:hypothetical protein n=1 Tax=Thioclava sp. F1Mire-8 TaxID=1973006 RepID=UPI000B541140|nr:hypothetical protein [Thioclava sp. F1Mire-8]OWX99682.1 hypothetical protein B6V75_18220 [Thioclava sp. F1Mire-8]
MNSERKAPSIDVAGNRDATKWSPRQKLLRLLWALAWPAFRLSPRIFWFWRRWILKAFGAKVGKGSHIYPSVKIIIPWNLTFGEYCAVGDGVILYALGPINIGARATVSQGAHLCAGTHDISKADRPLIKSKIKIDDDAWICADAFIGPDVSVGRHSVVGARAVVVRNVPEQVIVAGNPARKIGTTS